MESRIATRRLWGPGVVGVGPGVIYQPVLLNNTKAAITCMWFTNMDVVTRYLTLYLVPSGFTLTPSCKFVNAVPLPAPYVWTIGDEEMPVLILNQGDALWVESDGAGGGVGTIGFGWEA